MVEFFPAHVWDCPECGIENVYRNLPASQADIERIPQQYGLHRGEFNITKEITSMTCRDCKLVFDAKPYYQLHCDDGLSA